MSAGVGFVIFIVSVFAIVMTVVILSRFFSLVKTVESINRNLIVIQTQLSTPEIKK